MVAKYKGNLGMRLNVWKNFKLNLAGNYVDKRFAINDQANIRSRLNGYFTCDANLRYEINNFLVQFGVNNIFNKLYSEYGVFSTTSNEVGYYPSPGRNFLVKFEYNF